jgi:hypothetical protein
MCDSLMFRYLYSIYYSPTIQSEERDIEEGK